MHPWDPTFRALPPAVRAALREAVTLVADLIGALILAGNSAVPTIALRRLTAAALTAAGALWMRAALPPDVYALLTRPLADQLPAHFSPIQET